jgi:plasmid maintenance system antidote protein VapI
MNYRRMHFPHRIRAENTGLSTAVPVRIRRSVRCNEILLAYWRQVRGDVSIADFAATIGIPKATVSSIERGERRVTSDHLDRLAKVQGLTVPELLAAVAGLAAEH